MKFIERVKIFFKEVWTEIKKIDWPTRQETFKYTLIVIGITFGTAAFLGMLDFIFLKILEKFVF